MLFEHIFKGLNERKVKYMVIGGLAVNLYGFARATADMDILISFDDENVRNFIAVIRSLGLLSKAPVKIEEFANEESRKLWLEEKNMQVFSVYNPQNQLEQLDIILKNYIDFKTAYNRREILRAGDFDIPVVSIDDLIKLKQIAGRERDILDIKTLEKIRELRDEENS